MPNIVDASGITVKTQAELIADKVAAYLSIYGVDLSTLPSDNPDVQKMMNEVRSALDAQDMMVSTYNSFDPDKAIGTALDARLAYNGIQRQAGTFTLTNISVVISSAVSLPGLDISSNPFTVADAQGNKWLLVTTQNPVPGTYSYQFRAEFLGAVYTTPNTITVPVTIILGVDSVNNPTTYTSLGLAEESYARARVRRQGAVAQVSQGFEVALKSVLENISGIISASVHENKSSTVDSSGTPGHAIWVIVDGTPYIPLAAAYSGAVTYSYGDIVSSGGINYISWKDTNVGHLVTDPIYWGVYDPIAMAIYQKRGSGCNMYGSISYAITKKNGDQFVVQYSVVTQQDLYIQMTMTSLNGKVLPLSSAILAQLPVIFTPVTNEEVNINKLGTLVQQIDPNSLVTLSGFAFSGGGPFTNTLSPSTIDKRFAVSSAHIAIIVTPLP
jgi:hypothetical protein